MLRKREQRLVVTFSTTAQAIQMEEAARSAELAGRLIPLPRELSAGCGLAWSAPPDTEPALRGLLSRLQLIPRQMVLLTI